MEVVTIPIDKIRISPLNIRAGDQFGDDEDLELEKNVESMGLIQPILVRPVGDNYEVVVGRAVSSASRTAVPMKSPV